MGFKSYETTSHTWSRMVVKWMPRAPCSKTWCRCYSKGYFLKKGTGNTWLWYGVVWCITDPQSRISAEYSYERLHLTLSLLKLSKYPVYERSLLRSGYVDVALRIQVRICYLLTKGAYISFEDPCYHIRLSFRTKLMRYLAKRTIPVTFLPIVFLVVHDPEPEIKDFVRENIRPGSKLQGDNFLVSEERPLMCHGRYCWTK
jgi:hypothetical protein